MEAGGLPCTSAIFLLPGPLVPSILGSQRCTEGHSDTLLDGGWRGWFSLEHPPSSAFHHYHHHHHHGLSITPRPRSRESQDSWAVISGLLVYRENFYRKIRKRKLGQLFGSPLMSRTLLPKVTYY